MISRQIESMKRKIAQIEKKLEEMPAQQPASEIRGESGLYRYIGQAIAARRKAIGMRQHELADAIGKSRSAVGNIETGVERTTMINLYQIASVLNVAAKDLLPESIDLSEETYFRE